MRRREFITLLGGAAAAWPLAARAQPSGMPVVGFLRSTPSAPFAHLVTAFRLGLKEAGFAEGANVAIEQRWMEDKNDRLPALTADLISRKPAVIVANNPSALAAMAATKTIPIVFTTGTDPVQDGLVSSLSRPAGNVTGVSFLSGVLGSKRLELLRQIVPKTATIAAFVVLNTTEAEGEQRELQNAAQAIGQQLVVFDFSGGRDLEEAFTTLVQRGIGALLVGSGALLNTNREKIVGLAAHHAVPAIYPLREFATAGGLMSYGTSQRDAYRQAGVYAGRILKGEKPSDLPVVQSTKFEFLINLKTAKALGLEIPDRVLALADEVIE